MDKHTLSAAEPRVLELLKANHNGLGTGALLTAIDEIETPKDLVALLGDMKGRGLIIKNAATSLWEIALAAGVDDEPGGAAHEADAPLHPYAAAILRVVTEASPTRVRRKELCAQLPEFNEAVIGWHTRQLLVKGLIVAGLKNSDGYGLPGAATAPGKATPKPPKRQPNTALISKAAQKRSAEPPPQPAAAQEPPSAPIPPAEAAVKPAAEHDITIELTCPAGHLKLDGTPKLVFGFLEQLKALAA